MIKKVKLSPKEVLAYERASGFKTTGKVEVVWNDAAWKIYEDMLLKTESFDNNIIIL